VGISGAFRLLLVQYLSAVSCLFTALAIVAPTLVKHDTRTTSFFPDSNVEPIWFAAGPTCSRRILFDLLCLIGLWSSSAALAVWCQLLRLSLVLGS